MENSIITTGKSIELAIEAALKQLNLDRDSVSVEVLENARSGFLGIGASPAKVKVTYEVPDEPQAPKSALGAASRSKPAKAAAPVAPAATSVISRPGKKPVEQPKEEKKPEQRKPRNDRNDRRDNKPAEKKPQQPRPEKKAEPKPVEKKKPEAKAAEPKPVKAARTYEPAAAGSVEEQIEIFLKGLLEHMGSDAVPHAYQLDAESYRADLVGDHAGLLIGRRGDTLNAIQYLTGYAIGRAHV